MQNKNVTYLNLSTHDLMSYLSVFLIGYSSLLYCTQIPVPSQEKSEKSKGINSEWTFCILEVNKILNMQ